jgi:AraC family transcriptional regulator
MSIAAIAQRSGYGNVQSFTRIFKSVYGMPPATYRKKGSHARFAATDHERNEAVYDITIKTLPEMSAVTIAHRGSYMEINHAFDRLFGWLAARDLLGADLRSLAIFYDDVASVPVAELRSRACVLTPRRFDVEPPLERTTIAGGDYAILRHKGPYAYMKAAYDWLYGEWLPRSGREPGDAPGLEEYLNDPRATPPTELLSDICLPLRSLA